MTEFLCKEDIEVYALDSEDVCKAKTTIHKPGEMAPKETSPLHPYH